MIHVGTIFELKCLTKLFLTYHNELLKKSELDTFLRSVIYSKLQIIKTSRKI